MQPHRNFISSNNPCHPATTSPRARDPARPGQRQGRWHGSAVGWQSALARALTVEPRTIRRAVKDGPTDNLARALLALLGDGAPVRVPAEWICGDGSDGREYLVHTMAPRFLCLILSEDEYDAFEPQSDGDYQVCDNWLCAFHWIDRRPDNLSMWMERAADAVESFENRLPR